ncbi:MAG: hypothetical protein OEN49_07480 [Gammaproteobacteria bacterium]|nr:hypothetical protein [Gammaproteobacteria bacterium]
MATVTVCNLRIDYLARADKPTTNNMTYMVFAFSTTGAGPAQSY